MVKNYLLRDLDRDVEVTGGIRGINAAANIFKRAGGYNRYFAKDSKGRPKPVDYAPDLIMLASLYQVASQPFPNEHMAGPIKPGEVRRRFTEMKRVNPRYIVNPYGGRTDAVMPILRKVRTELRARLEELAPELLTPIDARNAKFTAEDTNLDLR